jgi:gas vesicle protein
VPSRAKEKVSEKIDAARSKVSEAASRAREAVAGTTPSAGDTAGGVAARVREATPSGQQVKRQARRAAGLAQQNPLGLAIGAAAVGFLAGLVVPSTRVEDERLGPVADQVKQQARETGQEALERGKQVAQEAASAAAETAKEHGQDLTDSAKQRAQEVSEHTRQQTTGP